MNIPKLYQENNQIQFMSLDIFVLEPRPHRKRFTICKFELRTFNKILEIEYYLNTFTCKAKILHLKKTKTHHFERLLQEMQMCFTTLPNTSG